MTAAPINGAFQLAAEGLMLDRVVVIAPHH